MKVLWAERFCDRVAAVHIDIGDTIDQMAARLYDRPIDRAGLANVATVLFFVCRQMRVAANEIEAVQGPARRVWLIKLAVTACERRLRWLGSNRRTATDDEIVWSVDRVLHVLAAALHVMEAHTAQKRRGEI
jgi:hypothetical protein